MVLSPLCVIEFNQSLFTILLEMVWMTVPVLLYHHIGTGDNSVISFSKYLRQGNHAPVSDPNGPYLGPLNICFDGTGSSDPAGDPLTFSWGFGDGDTGTATTPCRTYVDASIYDICLIILMLCGSCSLH